MINVHKKFSLMIILTIIVYFFIYNSPVYAFFSDSKIIKCEKDLTFLYQKKLFQKPLVKIRKEGKWENWCEGSGQYGDGELSFNEGSFHCKSFKNNNLIYSGMFDFVTKKFYSFVPLQSLNRNLKGERNCVVEDYK